VPRRPLQELCTGFPAAKWAPPAVARSTCCHSPAAAVELELARAAVLEQLRHKLASLCAKAGLRNVPLLSLERCGQPPAVLFTPPPPPCCLLCVGGRGLLLLLPERRSFQ
jgi:hypothetical protein